MVLRLVTAMWLIPLAAQLSRLPLRARSCQGDSIRWSLAGDQITVEYVQIPAFPHVRAHQLEKIGDVKKAPDSKNPSLDVVRMQLNGLNLNIPSQSSRLIWNFDLYLSRLERFIERAKAGDRDASLTWYDPWLVVGAVSVAFAAVLWIFVFTSLLVGPPETDPGR
jgi:hypothetical protein